LGGRTPLEIYAKAFSDMPSGTAWEERQAFTHPPWWKAPRTVIEARDEAVTAHNQITKDPKVLSVFTDGSGLNGHVAAAAVVPQMKFTRTAYLGSDEVATVYSAELTGMDMAAHLLQRLRERSGKTLRFQEAVIFTDSQAGIQALQRSDRRPSGQQILRRVLEALRATDFPVTIRWIPAHIGVSGNEAADKAAKEAARNQGSDAAAVAEALGIPLPGMTRLAAAAKTVIRREAQIQWERQWEAERTSAPTKRLIAAPSKRSLKVYKGLRKGHSSVLLQLRTGRIGLNHFLYKIGIKESDRCGCDEGSQTPRHILMACRLLSGLRQEMWRRIDKLGLERREDYDTLVNEPKAARYVADFMIKTGLLGQFQAVEPLNEEL
jgi:ribonuclease HI